MEYYYNKKGKEGKGKGKGSTDKTEERSWTHKKRSAEEAWRGDEAQERRRRKKKKKGTKGMGKGSSEGKSGKDKKG